MYGIVLVLKGYKIMGLIKEKLTTSKIKCPICKSNMLENGTKYVCSWCGIMIDTTKVTIKENK